MKEVIKKAIDAAFGEKGLHIDWQFRNAVAEKIIDALPAVAQRQRGPSLDAQHDAQLEGLAIGLLQRGEKSAAHIIRLAIDRLGVSAQGPTDRERAAQIIYEAFPFDGGAAEKPPWLPGGNSLMQDRARRAADAIVASARLTPAQAPMDREKVAKIFAYIWHGDIGEWQGFLSKADAFLTYPVPSTDRKSPDYGYCTCGRHASDQCDFCKRHVDGGALSSTNLGSPATGTPSREPTGEYTITPADCHTPAESTDNA